MRAESRPTQLDSPLVARAIKIGSRLNTKLYQVSGGRLGRKWRVGAGLRKPVDVCLLTAVGRKSGQQRTVPLLYLRDDERIVVVASQGGLASHPAWYLNVRENPDVSIQIGSTTAEYTAATADDTEREQLWPRLTQLYSDFDTYQAWTDRTIPVIICTPRSRQP